MTPEEHNIIVDRFFEVLDDLKARGVIRGLKTFTDRYDINRRSFRRVRETHSTEFRAVWLTYLVQDYKVSATWLLTGKGEMYA